MNCVPAMSHHVRKELTDRYFDKEVLCNVYELGNGLPIICSRSGTVMDVVIMVVPSKAC
jgi:hypothetical protein